MISFFANGEEYCSWRTPTRRSGGIIYVSASSALFIGRSGPHPSIPAPSRRAKGKVRNVRPPLG